MRAFLSKHLSYYPNVAVLYTGGHRVSVRVVQDRLAPNYRVFIGPCHLSTLHKLCLYRVLIGFFLFSTGLLRVACCTSLPERNKASSLKQINELALFLLVSVFF